MNFEKFVTDYKIIPVACELVVFNKEKRYAGKMDLLADVNQIRTFIDYKTSKFVHETHEAQLVAYKMALLSYPGDPFRVTRSKCMIVKLNYLKDLLVHTIADEEKAWDLFNLANDNYKKKSNGVKVMVE
jgi:CRISPR/Cas system-associated exonuclease Cas4 (RecB family)